MVCIMIFIFNLLKISFIIFIRFKVYSLCTCGNINPRCTFAPSFGTTCVSVLESEAPERDTSQNLDRLTEIEKTSPNQFYLVGSNGRKR